MGAAEYAKLKKTEKMEDKNNPAIHQIAQLIAQSNHCVVFSGAGISTRSGIPDFRSAGTGLWETSNPMLVASATAFRHHPDRFFNWLRPLLETSLQAQPNPAHHSLVEIEQMGILKAIITQNIDGLHQKAGSAVVIELHGSMKRFYCPVCHFQIQQLKHVYAAILAGKIPLCPRCNAILKPDITLFEEALPVNAWEHAERETLQADLMLIAGSSLEVAPASSLPALAQHQGCKIVIINFTPTFLDQYAEVTLNMDIAESLPRIVEKLKRMI